MDRKSYLRDRVKGMFLGVAIGDALGVPYEKLGHEEIAAAYGSDFSVYRDPNEKHFLKGVLKAGDISDDTQLTLAVAESLIACNGFNVEDQAMRHIKAMDESTFGWGKGTKSAIERLKSGVGACFSGTPNGAGNGIAMKISPLGALMAAMFFSDGGDRRRDIFLENSFDLALMTHRSAMAIASGWTQTRLIRLCFLTDSPDYENFKRSFLVEAISVCAESESPNLGMDEIKERLIDRFVEMLYASVCDLDIVPNIASMYSKKPFFVYDSLPLSYACFLKDPFSIESLYNAIRAGGDTDTNASMVGALLGALNGAGIFPENLVKGLNEQVYNQVMSAAYRFCERFVDIPTVY
jgi:ADP-ribosylglycohydrolase